MKSSLGEGVNGRLYGWMHHLKTSGDALFGMMKISLTFFLRHPSVIIAAIFGRGCGIYGT